MELRLLRSKSYIVCKPSRTTCKGINRYNFRLFYHSKVQASCDDGSLGQRRILDKLHSVAWTIASCREKLQRSQSAILGFLSTRECICLDPLQTTVKEVRQRTLNTRSWLQWSQLSLNLVMVYECKLRVWKPRSSKTIMETIVGLAANCKTSKNAYVSKLHHRNKAQKLARNATY